MLKLLITDDNLQITSVKFLVVTCYNLHDVSRGTWVRVTDLLRELSLSPV